MAKNWDQMTQAEKIEELRRDIINTMARVNQLDRHSDALERGISSLAGNFDDLVRRVAVLEKERK
jgi:hypothetical protein